VSYQTAKSFIRKWEGGVYRPTGAGDYDPNVTKWGVRDDTYQGYFGKDASVLNITDEQWDKIFTEGFWNRSGANVWPEPLDLVMADFAFNSGPKQALRYLQRAVGAAQDGTLGPETRNLTLEAVKTKGARSVAIMVQGQRIRFLKYLYGKSVEKVGAWRHCTEDGGTDCGARPQLAPISGWLSRVSDLGRTAGLN
jgi:Putative secretion activating protein